VGKNNNQEEKLGQEGPKNEAQKETCKRTTEEAGGSCAVERADVSLDERTMENVAILITVTMTALASARNEL
jgi:hypothetical protein